MFTFLNMGEAGPPPTFPLRHWCCFSALVLALVLYAAPLSFAAQPQSPPASSKTKSPNNKPKKASPAPHADTWAFSSNTPRPVDQIWTRGMAAQALKQAAVAGQKNKAPKKGGKVSPVPELSPQNSAQNRASNTESPPHVPDQEGFVVGKNMRVRSDSISSSWHNSSFKNDMRIDQDVIRQETNVYGAYADIESSEDFSLSAGPEFSHTRSQNSNQHNPSDTGSLGLGMQMKWGF